MIESLKQNKIGILLILFASLCLCTGQLFWKISVLGSIWFLGGGFILYGMGTVLMFSAYRFGNMSILQPMLSMNYVFGVILAIQVLNENIGLLQLIGITIITLSVILLGGSDE